MLRDIVERFSPDELVGQFVLSRQKITLGWVGDTSGPWHLAVEGRLPWVQMRSGETTIGWLLGQAITMDGHVVTQEVEVPQGDIESFIYEHGGRFLVILPQLGRVYLDPFGLLSAVYCEHAGMIASTPSLIPYDNRTPDRLELIGAMEIPHRSSMFPVGMTPRMNVERILPNHYLDLNSWKTVRHWPKRERQPLVKVSDATAEIADIAKRQLRAIHQHGPTTLQITAGKDSRLLLACSREFATDLDCLTVNFNDPVSHTDIRVARQITRYARVRRHRVLDFKAPEERDIGLWFYRTGLGTCEGRALRASTTLREQIEPENSLIFAAISELAKGKLWRAGDTSNTEITPERLVRCANCVATPETLAQVQEWMWATPIDDALQLLDLFYLEQRLGCWAGVWSYAAHCNAPAYPLSHRRVAELMLGLPEAKRRRADFHFDIIRREWPELMKFPFNPPTIRERARRLRGRLRNAGRRLLSELRGR